MTFKVGAQILTYGSTWDEALDVVRSLDDMGYTYIWGHDHLYSTGGDPYQGFFEGWTTLVGLGPGDDAGAARAAGRGQHVPQPGRRRQDGGDHRPRQPRPVDPGSRGRQRRLRERSPTASIPGKTMGQRMDWFEESLAIVVGLLAGEEVTHHSEKYQFEKVRHAPQPVQARIPVVIGADGEKRGLKLAARYADIWQWFAPFDGVATFRHKDEVLRAHADDRGPRRDDHRADARRQAHPPLRSRRGPARRRGARRDPQVGAVGLGRGLGDHPGACADRLVEFVEAGAHSFSPQIGWPYDRETIERLIGEVVPAVEARIAA